MATYSKEGTKLKGKLTEQISKEGLLDPSQSRNALKKVRRTLGAVLFSPDNQGYLDVVENGLANNVPAERIMKDLRRMSEKYVEAFSPVPGITEAHHVIPLNSLRDKVLELSLEDQIELFGRLDKAGWKLGDSPTQLMNTVLTRMSHQGQLPRMSGKNQDLKKLFQEVSLPEKSRTAHPRGTYDKLLQVQGGSLDEIWQDFTERVVPLAQQDVANALLIDANPRAAAAKLGLDLSEIMPETVSQQLTDPLQARQTKVAVGELASAYNPVEAPKLQELGISSQEFKAPGFVKQFSTEVVPGLQGYARESLEQLARRSFKTAAGLGALGVIAGVGERGAQAAEAEAAGDQAGVAKASAQIVGEIAGAVVPVADVANIATDVGSTYKELREAGVTHQQMAGAALDLAGKAIKEPGKVVKAVSEAVADIPEQTAAGFSYLGEKFRNMRSKLSLSGYSSF
jgi:hypothetical protein